MTSISPRGCAPVFAVVVAMTTACTNGSGVLTQQVEARHLVARLHVAFSQANEAAHRAVLADTDEASAAGAKESEQASLSVEQDLQRLGPLLRALAYDDEVAIVEEFSEKFSEYRKLDGEILPLAVENSNIKAQLLSFGAGTEAAGALFAALEAVQADRPAAADVVAAVATCRAAVLAIQVVQARHIAEPDDAAMTGMEAEIGVSEQTARAALDRLRRLRSSAARQQVTAAVAALDRFMTVNREITELSRRNSNVRSLALTLGRKRVVAAACEDLLRALEEALARHVFAATR